MKIKCNQDHWPASEGLLGFGAHGPEKIDGLTKNKTYDAAVINKIEGGGNYAVSNKYKFFLYNDNGEWSSYQTDLFEPI